MSAETTEAALDFMGRIGSETGQRKVKVTFHGGEPLMAGHALYRQALEGLAERCGSSGYEVALQSNLWLLDDQFCGLFREHRMEIGTSLDGPEDITDAQRGAGYFARTMRGVRLAQAQGMKVGCIATFTARNLRQWREVFDFFLAERLEFSIHAAVPPLHRTASDEWPGGLLRPAQYGLLLREMLDYYIEHRRDLAVASLDQICQGLGRGEGKVCTFRDCLGMFLAIDPDGGIYPCQRFCGRPEHRLGALQGRPTLAELFSSPMALRMKARQREVRNACDGCAHLEYCRGGCPYNAWAGANDGRTRDPYCEAYREVFDYIQKRVTEETACDENIKAIADRPWDGRGHVILRKGPLIELVREGPHPSRVARAAKRIVAAVELARRGDISSVGTRLVQLGLCRTRESADTSLKHLWQELHPGDVRLNNLYLHVTFECQLRCTHCYACAEVNEPPGSPAARGGTGARADQVAGMRVAAVEKLLREAKESGFEKVVITGGEPLIHSERGALLRALVSARCWARPMRLALRTNFALPLSERELRNIAEAFDQVIVSVDGNQQTHDARRGKGAHAAMVRNLEAYVSSICDPQRAMCNPGELSLACVMGAADIQGNAGQAVNELAKRLGLRRARFRPLLPLGRAKDWEEPPASEALGAHAEPMELIENGFRPVASCGLGQNLYVEPSGESFPCYAYHKGHALLGNVIEEGLSGVLASERFRGLASHCVDTNRKCRTCEVRYLCGGACRAWGGEVCQHELDAAPPECHGLRQRAAALYSAACQHLGLDARGNKGATT